MVLGFSWLAKKVMNIKKEQGIKVNCCQGGDCWNLMTTNSSRIRILDPIIQCCL
jgi:hypothetical protein